MLHFVQNINYFIAVLLTAAYGYQLVYILIGFIHKYRRKGAKASCLHKFAVIISARNEETVIGELIDSLSHQNYPSELLDIFVVADNCTDHTADRARQTGAIVYERFNKEQVGKGYALDYLFHKIWKDYPESGYDGYFIFDADNLVDPNFVAEMNKTFDCGRYDAITCYRNSKNFGDDWISAGYSIWFLREARFLNAARCAIGTSCAVSGTGFLVSERLVKKNQGWPFHLLTEDIQFSVECAVEGYVIGYCDKAIIYDEQPTTMRQSWDQRLRWSKGFYQVDWKYSWSLLKGIFRGGRQGFSCYDMLMTISPGMLLTLFTAIFNLGVVFACFYMPYYMSYWLIRMAIHFLVFAVLNFYGGMFLYGALTVASEWKNIRAKPIHKIAYLFTFPFFMMTYIPIAIIALLKKVEWKPIQHTSMNSRSVEKAKSSEQVVL